MDLYGEWAEQEVSFIRRFLRSGDVVLDVGANIGTHTVPLANAVGGLGQIHAFEPQRLSFQLLCTNVALNSLDNVFAQHAALGTEPGFATVPVLPFDEKANLGNLNIEGHEVGEQVPMRTIDGLMLSRIDFIKIDVEGMEEKVLGGGLDSIKRHRPILYVENNIPDRSSSLIRCLHDLGYRCWWHLEEYFNPGNYFRQRKNIFSKIGRPEINLLCLPEGSSVSEPDLELVRGEDDTWQAASSRSKAAPRE
jgi:FkbM family methyltransferase